MKIVVLDGIPLNPGDLDWASLRELGDLKVFDRTAPHEVLERVREAEVILTNKVRLPREVLEAAPHLRLVSVLATGYDVVDIEVARERGILVCNVPTYSSNFTAQTTWALILELAHHVGLHNEAVKDGEWSRCPDFSFWKTPLVELDGKTLLIFGRGRIGRRVERIATAFGTKVLWAQVPGREGHRDRVSWEEGFRKADVISLHCPLTPDTRRMINADRLSQMKASTLLVNTARGALIDEAALAEALDNRIIAGYAADVLDGEPPTPDNPLLKAPNCILTPHFAWASRETRARLLDISIENLRAFGRGQAQNVVS